MNTSTATLPGVQALDRRPVVSPDAWLTKRKKILRSALERPQWGGLDCVDGSVPDGETNYRARLF